MVNFAGTLTGRLTPDKVAMGDISPKVVSAHVGTTFSGTRLTRRAPLRELNAPRRITRAILFLTRGGCVAKRSVSISNKVII